MRKKNLPNKGIIPKLKQITEIGMNLITKGFSDPY